MDFAEAHAQKQLDQDEQREAAIRADERRRVLNALERWAAPRYWDNDEDKANLEEWIQGMRREGEQ